MSERVKVVYFLMTYLCNRVGLILCKQQQTIKFIFNIQMLQKYHQFLTFRCNNF